MRRAGLTALFMLAGLTAAIAQEDPPIDCTEPQGQTEINICAGQAFEKADKELNSVYKKAVKSQQDVDKRAAEMGPGYVGAVKALKKAQRAWIDYRDGHCDGVGYEAVGGSMSGMLAANCLEALTKSRIKELKELTAGLGGD